MNRCQTILAACLPFFGGTFLAWAQGSAFTYQGRLTDGGAPASGKYDLRFSVFNSSGGPSLVGGPITNSAVQVSNGVFTVTLDFGAGVFTGENRWLQIAVRLNGSASDFTALTPRDALLPAPYSILAGNVPAGAISSLQLAPGAVTGAALADNISLGSANLAGQLDIFRTAAGTAAISLAGSSSRISTYGSDGLEQTRLSGTTSGELRLFNSLPSNDLAVDLSANGADGGFLELSGSNGVRHAYLAGDNGGGFLRLYNTNGSSRAFLSGISSGGSLTLFQADGNPGVFLDGDSNGYGLLSVRRTNGAVRAELLGGPASGTFNLYNRSGNKSVVLWNYGEDTGVVSVHNTAGDERGYLWGANAVGSGELALKGATGTPTVLLQGAETASTGSQLLMYQADGTRTVQLDAEAGAGGGGYIDLRKADGTATVILRADASGNGKVTTQVLQITGGADLSEQFNIQSSHGPIEPGLVVCIDPARPGELVVSTKPYDRTVAGVMSGAGGVTPGMLMGQAGTAADGKHPVALTGRVYCRADASHGAIHSGDLLTTSSLPGHAMKVTNYKKAQGAILGKAMSSLEKGQGLVLVLVTLQ